MSLGFGVHLSRKHGFDSPEKYVVAREGIGYLRLLGSEPHWELVTATADEDDCDITVCTDKLRLLKSALRLGEEIGTGPEIHRDRQGRDYVWICVVIQKPGEERESVSRKLERLLTRFFEIYDEPLTQVKIKQ